MENINALMPNENLMVVIKEGSVTCDLVDFSSKIKLITDYLTNLEVTEETLKETKKLMARVNNAIKDLSKTRIEAKKSYLRPFTTFEEEIKALEKEVKTANDLVREQTRIFDEKERDAKEELLRDKWNLRIHNKVAENFFDFEDFLKPTHLNKSVTIKKVEQEMAEFLNRIETDIVKLIPACRENHFPVQAGLDIYKKNYNYGDFLSELESLVHIEEKIEEIIETPETEEIYSEPEYVYFKVPYAVSGVIENYLKTNKIPYEQLVD